MSLLQFALCFFIYHLKLTNSSTPFVAPINKDESTKVYTISIPIKTPLQLTDLLLDLGGKFSWIDCTPGFYTSTSHHYILCATTLCDSLGSLACTNCFQPSGPGCHNNSCALFPENPLIRNTVVAQALVDLIALTTTDGRKDGQLGLVPNFVFSCSDDSLLRGLPDGVSGLVGLGRSNYSLPAQVSSVYASPNIFALCLPGPSTTTPGSAFFNTAGPYYFSPEEIDLSTHLKYTPLIINPIGFTIITYSHLPSAEYFIELTSITINGKPVEINQTLLTINKHGFGGTRISTITPYTILETSIYNTFIKAFINESKALNLTTTDPVSPFDVCYDGNEVDCTEVGPGVPVIDLVMHSEDVFWRIFGANSMVSVERDDGEDLWCLGFVDGGENPRSSVVIGGRQMEDNLLQFDLDSERLGFSSSVLVHGTNCSSFNFTYDYGL